MGTSDSSTGKTFRLRALSLIAALVFIFTLALRLWSITAPAPQPDEILWTSRSAKVLHRAKLLKEKGIAAYTAEYGYLNITAHLPHPGLIPALIMATAQHTATRVNVSLNLSPETDRYIDSLSASRIGIAVVSSLIAPLLLIGLTPIISFWPALLAALMLAIDPRHLLISRMAHLDSVLAVFVIATLLVYMRSIQQSSLRLKTLAGLLWGCCLLIKPTSLVLIPCFIIYKCIRNLLIPPGRSGGERSIVAWSDIWAILVAHALFSLCYTRLWIHRSEYRVRMQIRALAAKYLWRCGKYLHSHPQVSLTLIAFFSALTAYFLMKFRRTRIRWQRHLGLALALFTFLLTGITCFPQVFENLARYWAWVLGLSGTTHDSFGTVVAPPSYGYIDLLLTELPTSVLLGLVPGIFFVLRRLRKDRRNESSIALLSFLALPILWLAILSISPKQTWRYAIPIVPCIYVIAAFGVYELAKTISLRLSPGSHRTSAIRVVNAIVVPCIVLAHLLPVIALTPEYHLYFNRSSGGLASALERSSGIPFSGQNEIVRYLMKTARGRRSKTPLYVTVFGSESTLRKTTERIYGESASGKLVFGFYPKTVSDYLVVFETHPHLIHYDSWGNVISQQPVFRYSHSGLTLASVYETPYENYEEPFIVSVSNSHRNTGRLISSKITGKKAIHADLDMHARGYLLFTPGLRLPAGIFTVSFAALISAEDITADNSQLPVLQLELGSCKETLSAREILDTRDTEFRVTISCAVPKAGRYSPNIYWHGTVPVSIGSVFIQRTHPSLPE